MKKNNNRYIYALLFSILALSGNVYSQNAPTTGKQPVAIPVTQTVINNPSINFIRIWEPGMPSSDTAVIPAAGRTITEVRQTTQYLDGLGRPLQSVSKGISAGGKDVVAPIVYDTLGHERYKYLPYIPQTGNYNDGRFKSDPFNSQKSFYNTDALNPGVTGDSIYYTQTEYELSPLNRILKTYAPGNSWAKEGGNHPIENRYLLNTLSDSVHIWNLSADIPTDSGIYPAGQLFKTVLVDETGSQIIEYKDKEDHVILKKVQLSDVADTLHAHTNWLCTYNVYDKFSNLRSVIPPLAVEKIIGNNWVISTLLANELCFQYQYDNRNRIIVKRVPGMGPVNMVYDTRDRVVFTQDSIQRQQSPQEWLVTFYDGLDRPSMTAIYKANTSRAALQASMNTVSSGTQTVSYTFPAAADMVLGSYDGSSAYVATKTITMQDGFDTGIGAESSAYIDSTLNTGTTTLTVSNPLPGIAASALTPLTYMFYDNYDFPGKLNYESGEVAKLRAGNNPYAETQPTGGSTMTRGLITGNKVRVLGTEQWLTTTSYYDDKGRVIQVVSDNNAGGKDITTNQYDFNGKMLSSFLRHKNPRSGVTPQTTLLTMLSYDHAGRLMSTTKRLNGDSTQEKIIAANSYNELGELKQKRLGALKSGGQLDTLSYTYNVRGWLLGINKSFVNTTGSNDNWFGEELSYDYGFDSIQYNGNIAGAKWKSRSDGTARAFGYNYDKPSRLKAAYFTQQNSGAVTWMQDKVNFSVSNLSYDANGNIKTMAQKGMIGNASTVIDQLTYSYPTTGSNKLSSVSDTSNTASAKLGDFINGTNTVDDYSYDVNGNMIQDLNKGISSISYNYLNLPTIIKIKGKGVITYQYDASGAKLKKTVTDSTISTPKITVTDYIGGFVYEQDTLQLLLHEEGRIRPIYKTGLPVSFVYDYFEKDHLGNVRVVLGAKSDTAYYTATMETGASAVENALFSNIDNTRTLISSIIGGYPTDNTTNPNAYVAKLNGSTGGQKIGPSLVLRVMAGDTIQINTTGVYTSSAANTSINTPPDMISAILNAFSGSGISDGVHGAFGAGSAIGIGLTQGVFNGLKQIDTSQNVSSKPKAYLNFALFDDRFALVNENSGVRQIQGNPNVLQLLSVGKMVIKKTGFLYIYSSNESGSDVFFDNLVVTHNTGPLLEETHYYPFGLAMAGISSKALKGTNYEENKLKYNKGSELQQKEFLDNSGLELYLTQLRSLDPQIGRWLQLDSKPDYSLSLYNSMGNNPIRYNDPLGDTTRGYTQRSAELMIQAIKNSFTGKTAMQGLFTLGKDGKTLNSIKVSDFLKAAKDLSTDQFLLGVAYFVAINDESNQVVSITRNDEPTEAGINELTHVSYGGAVDAQSGGGFNQPFGKNGSLTVLVSNSSQFVTDYAGSKGHSPSLGELISHEMLGHGMGYSSGSMTQYHEDALQMSNLYLRTQGDYNYRDGSDHGTILNQRLSKEQATRIPEFYRNNAIVLKMMLFLK